ncbi:DMT family transporter [Sphingobium sp.]|uniref:DMT family transporter n=1 Tax=Sphingobium sp. TaxID=1912891 RepID=UPI000DB23D7A|nr:DMT family transporter [Sphingobium sp.]PZU68647.1 MAG: EamA family transporter [Sphingobium sp.]
MPEDSNKQRATFENVIAMIISGSIGIFVIYSGQSAPNVVFFRCLVAAIVLIPYCWLNGLFRREYLATRDVAYVLVAGILMVINWVLLFQAYPLTSISWATIVYHINPFIILMGGAVFFGQALTRHTVIWTAIAFGGLFLLSGVSADLRELSGREGYGLTLVLVATTLYSGTTLLMKKNSAVPPTLAVCLQTIVGTFILAPFLSVTALPATAFSWACVITLGIVHTFLLYYLIFKSIKTLDVRSIAILSFIYPLSAAGLDFLFFGHTLSGIQWLGAAIIFASTLAIKLGWNLFPKSSRRSV